MKTLITLLTAIFTVLYTTTTEPVKVPDFTEVWDCTCMVGDETTPTQIFKCLDNETNLCYYVNRDGKLSKTDCLPYVFVLLEEK